MRHGTAGPSFVGVTSHSIQPHSTSPLQTISRARWMAYNPDLNQLRGTRGTRLLNEMTVNDKT